MASKKNTVAKAAIKPRAASPKKAARSLAAAATGTPPKPQFADFVPLQPADIIIRLVRDAVYARIRHRALLEALAEGEFVPKRYREKFKEIVQRDYRGLYAKLVLAEADFQTLHAEWCEEDERFYRKFFGGNEQTIDHEETR